MEYVISDLHFDHENIIEYCNRPFGSVEEMNETLVANWNERVGTNDVVYLLGDLTIAGTAEAFLKWISRLTGEIVFVVGDHDSEVFTTLDQVTVCEYYHLYYRGHRFYCVHDPADGPRDPEQWVLHGHHHNNWPNKYPFLNPKGRLINVSAELIGYEPLALDDLLSFMNADEWMETIADSQTSDSI